MTISIELDNRQYADIENYCLVNNISVQDYLTDIILEKHSINKFGDLNDIIPVKIEEGTVEVKKRVGRKKKSETQTDEKDLEKKGTEIVPKVISTIDEATNVKPNMEEANNREEVVNTTVKRKRTLKTL